ncbi:TonB-dependent receptor [Kiritimatiellota bacterium B12222]|nr:TonB-dependent receptor [Kiritimatiellota bacterium B12222]
MKKLSFTLYSLFFISAVFAEETQILAPLTVLGGAEDIRQQVGSATYLDEEDIEKFNQINVSRILQQVPGVYIRDEEGFGNFPNISLRGADGTRSSKLTVMEDGVITAPAPYSAPAAYYFPTVSRMAGIEILKGSSQVRFGPHSTGGVINFLSTPIPAEQSGRVRSSYGSFNSFNFLGNFGETVETSHGQFGYLVEFLYQNTDGFRDIQKVGGDTGFSKAEPMLKMFWEPDTAMPQRFELKVGSTDFEANETYLGLSESDVRAHPQARYAASQFDLMDTEQFRSFLRYTAQPNENLDIESTLYYNSFDRSWYKIDQVSTDAAPGVDSRGRISDRTSLDVALLDGNPNLAVLKGDATGSIGVKDNDRSYKAYGWETAFTQRFETGEVSHALTGGVRLHYDYVDRFQYVDIYSGQGNGYFSLYREGIPGEEADRKEETFATAVYVEDVIQWGAWTVKPGVRGEFLQYEVDNYGDKADDNLNAWTAGIGAAYDLSLDTIFFGGLYRGISTPGANAYISNGIEPEESLSGELGMRHFAERSAFEVAGFYTDYSNLIGTDAGIGNDDSNVNAGEATVYGVEGQISGELASRNAGYRLPAYVNLTFTQATLDEALASGGGDNIYAGGVAGADLPYVPDWKFSFGISYVQQKFALNLEGSWVDYSYGTAKNLDAPVDSAQEGKIDEVFLVDLSASYDLSDVVNVFAGVNNLTDENYISSRLPYGARTGAPRSMYAGFEVDW